MPAASRRLELRSSSTAAHVVPLLLFVLLTSLPSLFRIENAALPWYRQGPEHWMYPMQTLLCGGLLWWWRTHYQLNPWRMLPLAVLLGGLGIAMWIAPNFIFRIMSLENGGWEPGIWKWFGFTERLDGFDPALLESWPAWQAGSVFMRFVRMVVVVPLVEEVFWRGFLMRYIVAEIRHTGWRQIPFGSHHWLSFAITTLAVTFIHNSEDWAAAFIWGSLMYWLAARSKSLGACVVMHAVGNLMLGVYVLQSRQWGFW